MPEFSLGEAALGTSVDLSGLTSGIQEAEGQARSGFGRIADTIGGVLKTGIAVAGGALVGALGAAAYSGLSFNNSMEQVTAQLNAFTKDGAKSAEILEMIRQRAASTPFAFEDMARATAGLLPAAKASGAGLEELVGIAEILAASNPAEGLEGAAFALREAVSGDFASVIERFNLPRQRLNELKEQGVPALEAVSIAMREMGFDADLVSNLANTASGRWSTFLDTLQGVAATAMAPIFNAFSGGLADVNTWLTANQPLLEQVGATIAGALSQAIAWLSSDGIPALVAGWRALQPAIAAASDIISQVSGYLQATSAESGTLSGVLTDLGAIWQQLLGVVQNVAAGYQAIIQAVLPVVRQFVATHGDEISAFFQSTYDRIIEIVQLALQLYNAIVPPILQAIAGFIASHSTEINAILSNTWTAISTVITVVLETIKGVITAALQIIQGDWSGAWQTIQNTCATIVQGILTIITSNIETIKIVFGGMVESIHGILQGLANSAVGLGANIINGIINGVNGAAGSLLATLRGIATSALKAAQDAIKIGSPSKAFADEVGRPIVDGIIFGINGGRQALTEAMAGSVEPALDTATSVVQRYIDAVLEDGDYLNDWLTHLPEVVRPALREVAQAGGDSMAALQNYINAVLEDGDHLNDWLTHLPEHVRGSIREFGALLASEQDAASGFPELEQAASSALGTVIDYATGAARALEALQQSFAGLGGATMPGLPLPSMGGGSMSSLPLQSTASPFTINIDARNANLSPGQIEASVNRALDERSRFADAFSRTR